MTDINNNENDKLNRREFINKVAIGSVAGAGGLFCIASIKSCLPKVLNEPPSIFKIGFPNDFSANSVNFLANNNVFVMRYPAGFRALSAICTHLGCIVQDTGTGYSCPCHGSKFSKTGSVIAGPAPRALDWFEITVAPDGQLIINSKVKVGHKTIFAV